MFDFPNAPTIGQVATTPAGATFTWDGAKWVAGGATTVSIAAGTGLSVSPSPITGSGTVSLSTPVSVANGGTGSTTAAAGPFVQKAGDAMTGRLDIGTPISGIQALGARGPSAAGGNVVGFAGGPAGSDTTTYLIIFTDATAGTGFLGGIARNGTGTVAYGTSSDARLKEGINDSETGLAALLALKVRDYRFVGSARVEQGFIAQEVNEVYPAVVRPGGDDPATQPWIIEYGRFTPLLVRAVQELAADVVALNARLAALEAPR